MKNLTLSLLLSAATAVLLIGCNSESGNSGSPNVVNTPPPDTVPHEHGHSHSHSGPHDGTVIDLGNEYHAEWLMSPHQHETDEGHAEVLSIYILDGSAKKAIPIDAAEVAINLTHDGQPEQFKLAAMPTEDDPAGQSSRFTSGDAELLAHFHEKEIAVTLVVTIEGKSYRGKIAHDHHGHGSHGHGH